MKFSVLLPTRNRLEYLKLAIETVLRQDYPDWEIVVSDNCSEQDIAGYIKEIGDARIKYYRTESFVPVTENWNNALEKSTGDYIIMLGDDDGLLKGYFSTILPLIAQYEEPDFIYTSAFVFAYPGVMPGYPQGYLQPYGYARFLRAAAEPYLLGDRAATDLVRHSLNFRVRFGYNMQFSLVSRRFIDAQKSKGPFFQSPYPDYYATNVLFLKAKRRLILPKPLVVIGITPKSFGYYYFNKCEKHGIAFLQNYPDPEQAKRIERVVLPGTDINTSWLLALESIKSNYGSELPARIGYGRYRLLQIFTFYEAHFGEKRLERHEVKEMLDAMSLREKIAYGIGMASLLRLVGMLPPAIRRRAFSVLRLSLGQYPLWRPRKHTSAYNDLIDVFERVDPLHG